MKLSTVRILEGLPGITGEGSQLIRLDPDLEKKSLLLPGRIEFARADPSAGRHVLPINGLDDTAISYRVLVFQLPAQDILIDPWDRLQSRRENLFLAKARGATPARDKSSPALRVEPVVYPTYLLVSDNFHVLVPVRSKALIRRNPVFIDHAEAGEATPILIMLFPEAESMVGIKPAMVGAAPFV